MDLRHIKETLASEGFKAAMALENMEQRAQAFTALFDSLVDAHGDLGAGVAPAYFAYADACLRQVEESDNFFGAGMGGEDVAKEAPASIEKTTAIEEGPSPDDVMQLLMDEYAERHGKEPDEETLAQWKETFASAGSASLEEVETPPAPAPVQAKPLSAEDLDELREVAWESLETARQIYERVANETSDPNVVGRLVDTYVRLADLSQESENFIQALEDYSAALEKCLKSDKRAIAQIRLGLGNSSLYASSMAPPEDQSKEETAKHRAKLRAKSKEEFTEALKAYHSAVSTKTCLTLEEILKDDSVGESDSLVLKEIKAKIDDVESVLHDPSQVDDATAKAGQIVEEQFKANKPIEEIGFNAENAAEQGGFGGFEAGAAKAMTILQPKRKLEDISEDAAKRPKT